MIGQAHVVVIGTAIVRINSIYSKILKTGNQASKTTIKAKELTD